MTTARTIAEQIRSQHNEAAPDEPRDMAYDLTIGEAEALIEAALIAARAEAEAEWLRRVGAPTDPDVAAAWVDALVAKAEQVDTFKAERDAARAELEHWRSAALDHGHPDAHSWSLSTDDMKAQLLTAKAEGAREALEQAAEEWQAENAKGSTFYMGEVYDWLRARAQEGR